MKIAVLGAGAWGTALAVVFAKRHAVTLWARDSALVEEMMRERVNRKYLPAIQLVPAIEMTGDLAAATQGADLLLIATSTGGLAATVNAVKSSGLPVVWVCKGFDRATGKLPHESVAGILPASAKYGALSGPSFAAEVALGLPCALTLAANDFDFAQRAAGHLNGPALRIYSSNDLIGVELGGALKNVMAIASGLCDGMQLGMNARAALITRGLAEMVRLGAAMGGKPETFMGLTGLGDLVLTATGSLSRNRAVGVGLAEGKSLHEVLSSLGHVAEGVNSAQTALRLARDKGVEMPITEAVNAVLFDGADPRATVQRLLAREARTEMH